MSTSFLAAKILLIESDSATAARIRAALDEAGSGLFDVERVGALCEGLERLKRRGIAAVLLDLTLPDSHGLETFDKLFAAAPDIPILILGGKDSDAVVKQAVGRGAQDY